MKELRTTHDILERANLLSAKKCYFVLLSLELKLYIEVFFGSDVVLIGGDSGTGKTLMLNTLQDLITNRDTELEICYPNLDRIHVALDSTVPINISAIQDKNSIYFVDHGDLLLPSNVDALNQFTENGGSLVLFARGSTGILATVAPFGNKLTAKKIDGITCFMIK